MSYCCFFCGSNAESKVFISPKYSSWVMHPKNPYPICNLCMEAMEKDTISERINLKFRAKQTPLEEKDVKRMERLMKGKENDSRGVSTHSKPIGEVK